MKTLPFKITKAQIDKIVKDESEAYTISTGNCKKLLKDIASLHSSAKAKEISSVRILRAAMKQVNSKIPKIEKRYDIFPTTTLGRAKYAKEIMTLQEALKNKEVKMSVYLGWQSSGINRSYTAIDTMQDKIDFLSN